MKLMQALVSFLAVSLTTTVSAVTVYSNNFDNAPAVAGGVTAAFDPAGGAGQATVAPYASQGSLFRNSTLGLTTLTLSNLPDHGSVDISFVMAFLDSWDSTDGTPAPDYLNLFIDGNPFAQYTYNNASGTVKSIGGGTLLAEYTQFDSNIFYSDTAVDMSNAPELSIAHSSSTLTLAWQASGAGWQGGGDEAWGIDDLRVDVEGTAVPLPSGMALLLGGVLLLTSVFSRRLT